jgi:hypothetical protein
VFPTGTIVNLITNDRQREADNARLARSVTPDEQRQAPRRARRIRAAATRIAAFSTLR